MLVRGWILIGPPSCGHKLPLSKFLGRYEPTPTTDFGVLPDASDFEPGDWIGWRPSADSPSVVAVCVDVPL